MTAGTGRAGGLEVVESGGSGDSREWEMGEGRVRGGRVNIVPWQEVVEEKRAGTVARGVCVGEVVRGSGVEEAGQAASSHMTVREGEHVERGCAAGVGARAVGGRGDSAAAEEWGTAGSLSRTRAQPTPICPDLPVLVAMMPGSTPSAGAAGPWAGAPSSVGSHRSAHADACASMEGHLCKEPSLIVFSGGTAFNAVAEELHEWTTAVAHVLPVSDDGGSTAEIVHIIGGPAIGDIRLRCMHLSDGSSHEARAVRRLLGHRLPLHPVQAKAEWLSIVEGEHELWGGVSDPYKEIIRAFLLHFHYQCSVGNFFFSGSRSFFRSLDAAIFLFSRVSNIPQRSLVLPCVCTNDRFTLGVELPPHTPLLPSTHASHPTFILTKAAIQLFTASNAYQLMERASRVFLLPVFLSLFLPPFSLQSSDASPPLPAPIRHVFYMSSEGTNLLHEHMASVDGIIYGIGSLFTSICPSLVPTYTPLSYHLLVLTICVHLPHFLLLSCSHYHYLARGGRSNHRTSMSQGMAECTRISQGMLCSAAHPINSLCSSLAILLFTGSFLVGEGVSSEGKARSGITCCVACFPHAPQPRMAWQVLVLNGSLDRETAGMAASDFVLAICNCLNRTFGDDSRHRLTHSVRCTRHRSHLCIPGCFQLPLTLHPFHSCSPLLWPPISDPLQSMHYVTHLIAPEGGAIPLDYERLTYLGVTSLVSPATYPLLQDVTLSCLWTAFHVIPWFPRFPVKAVLECIMVCMRLSQH
ncbi:unnamed protein product [Closterium sp. Naga37s-1]|nr:unnamed protein product [Closterium sp. Naga37s-1]